MSIARIGDLVQPSFECALKGTYSSMTDSKAQKEYNAILNDLGIGIIINSTTHAVRRGGPDEHTYTLYTVRWSKKSKSPAGMPRHRRGLPYAADDLIVIQSVEEESNK